MEARIIVADEQWPREHDGDFDPSIIPLSARVVPFDIEAHVWRIGYTLLTFDGVLIIDGMNIRAHEAVAKVYYTLMHDRQYDETGYQEFRSTIKGGWAWPPIVVVLGSRSFPERISRDEEREMLQTLAPGGIVEFSTSLVNFDLGGVEEKLLRHTLEHVRHRLAARTTEIESLNGVVDQLERELGASS